MADQGLSAEVAGYAAIGRYMVTPSHLVRHMRELMVDAITSANLRNAPNLANIEMGETPAIPLANSFFGMREHPSIHHHRTGLTTRPAGRMVCGRWRQPRTPLRIGLAGDFLAPLHAPTS
jgi:hypothetical protein